MEYTRSRFLRREETGVPGENPRSQSTYNICSRGGGRDWCFYNASLTSQEVQHRVFYPDGHPSRYQLCPTELNFGEQTGTGVFPVVIAVPINNRRLYSTRVMQIIISTHNPSFFEGGRRASLALFRKATVLVLVLSNLSSAGDISKRVNWGGGGRLLSFFFNHRDYSPLSFFIFKSALSFKLNRQRYFKCIHFWRTKNWPSLLIVWKK